MAISPLLPVCCFCQSQTESHSQLLWIETLMSPCIPPPCLYPLYLFRYPGLSVLLSKCLFFPSFHFLLTLLRSRPWSASCISLKCLFLWIHCLTLAGLISSNRLLKLYWVPRYCKIKPPCFSWRSVCSIHCSQSCSLTWITYRFKWDIGFEGLFFLKVKTLCMHCVDNLSQGLFWGTHWNLSVNLCWTQVVGSICWWTPGLCALELTSQGPGVPQPLETPPEKCVPGNAYPYQMLNILIRATCILQVFSSEMVAVLNICDSNIAQRLVNV